MKHLHKGVLCVEVNLIRRVVDCANYTSSDFYVKWAFVYLVLLRLVTFKFYNIADKSYRTARPLRAIRYSRLHIDWFTSYNLYHFHSAYHHTILSDLRTNRLCGSLTLGYKLHLSFQDNLLTLRLCVWVFQRFVSSVRVSYSAIAIWPCDNRLPSVRSKARFPLA